MKRFFLLFFLLLPSLAAATQQNIIVSYEPHASWQDNGSATWMDLDIDGTVASRRIAVALKAGNTEIIRLWDDPANRTLPPVSFDMTGPRAKITGQTYAYEGGPWKASTAFALDDKVSVGNKIVLLASDYDPPFPADVILPEKPSANYYWQCTRAGITGTTEPTWPDRVTLADGNQYFFDSKQKGIFGDAVDNGDGTVNLPVTAHAFVEGEQVTITGTTNYDATYTLPTQTNGDADNVEITAAYVAETLASPAEIHLTAGEIIDNADGTVTIPAPGHGFVQSDAVTISNTVNYDAAYTLPVQTNGDADNLVITATYVTENTLPAGKAYPTNGNVIDNGGGTVNIPAPAHGYVAGDVIDITGTTNYDSAYTLPVQTNGDADNVEITATFVAETIGPSDYARKRVEDPDGAGAQWKFVYDSQTVLESEPTGRIIVRQPATGNTVLRSGTNFIRRSGP